MDIGSAIGAGLDYASAQAVADAQKEAARINAEAIKAVNEANLANSRLARGEGGSPVKLPLYTGNYESGTLFPAAQGIFDAAIKSWGSPSQMIARNQKIVNSMYPAMQQGQQMSNDLFSGARTKQQLEQFQPVAGARLADAAAQKQSINTALNSLQNRANALAANRGYAGGSTFDDAARLRAAVPMFQEAAKADTGARLANATDIKGIRDSNWNLAFQNLDLPTKLAAQQIAMDQMPVNQAANAFGQAFQVFNPFMLNEYKPPTMQAPPAVQPVMSAWGNAANVAGNLVNNYNNAQAYQQAINALASANASASAVPVQQSAWNSVANFMPTYGTNNNWSGWMDQYYGDTSNFGGQGGMDWFQTTPV